jgi:hypothetical protein
VLVHDVDNIDARQQLLNKVWWNHASFIIGDA